MNWNWFKDLFICVAYCFGFYSDYDLDYFYPVAEDEEDA